MADGDVLPNSFPPMGAEFEKPYMEFEYNGKMYRLDQLKGGHNKPKVTDPVMACKTSPPVWDPVKKRWVVTLENNMIDIDVGAQPDASRALPEELSALKRMHIFNSPRRSRRSYGYLYPASSTADEPPKFPVDCEFHMFIRVAVPGRPSLANVTPFKLEAKALSEWPPKVGTVYTHDDEVALYPEWLPFARTLMKPLVRIPSGDETILTEIYLAERTDEGEAAPQRGNWFTRLWNRVT